MRGLKKTAPNGADRQTDIHTDRHGDSMTNSAQRGRVGENVSPQELLQRVVPKKLALWSYYQEASHNRLATRSFYQEARLKE